MRSRYNVRGSLKNVWAQSSSSQQDQSYLGEEIDM